MKRLPNDISRCSPENCSEKDTCLRYTCRGNSEYASYIDFSKIKKENKCEFKIEKL